MSASTPLEALPVGPGDAIPLFSLDPGLLRTLAVLAALALAWWLIRRWMKNRPPPAPTEATPPTAGARTASAFEKGIEAIRRSTIASEDWRGGLHALAREVRVSLEERTGLQTEEMTADEIARAFSKGDVARAMRRLRDDRFSPDDVTRDTFEHHCDRVASVFGPKRNLKRR